jgi:hypothetical protein
MSNNENREENSPDKTGGFYEPGFNPNREDLVLRSICYYYDLLTLVFSDLKIETEIYENLYDLFFTCLNCFI